LAAKDLPTPLSRLLPFYPYLSLSATYMPPEDFFYAWSVGSDDDSFPTGGIPATDVSSRKIRMLQGEAIS